MSGRGHTVMSGLVVTTKRGRSVPASNAPRSSSRTSRRREQRYVDFGEWEDARGGYAIRRWLIPVERRREASRTWSAFPVGLLAELGADLFERL